MDTSTQVMDPSTQAMDPSTQAMFIQPHQIPEISLADDNDEFNDEPADGQIIGNVIKYVVVVASNNTSYAIASTNIAECVSWHHNILKDTKPWNFRGKCVVATFGLCDDGKLKIVSLKYKD